MPDSRDEARPHEDARDGIDQLTSITAQLENARASMESMLRAALGHVNDLAARLNEPAGEEAQRILAGVIRQSHALDEMLSSFSAGARDAIRQGEEALRRDEGGDADASAEESHEPSERGRPER